MCALIPVSPSFLFVLPACCHTLAAFMESRITVQTELPEGSVISLGASQAHSIPCVCCALLFSVDSGALSRLVARSWRPKICPHPGPWQEQTSSTREDSLPTAVQQAELSTPGVRKPAFHEAVNDVPNLPAIFMLPVELFIAIFEIVIRDENATYTGFTPTFTIRRLMHVCQHWRAVAISTAVFWRYIDTTRPPPWVSLCLARSRACLLDVYIAIRPRRPSAALELLLPHTHHFRSLVARVPTGRLGKGYYWKRLCPLFNAGMPELERLELIPVHTDGVRERDLPEVVADYALSRSKLPRLRWLAAGLVVLPAPQDFWRGLRVLTMYDYLGPDASPRAFGELVTVLAQNPTLEELHIRRFAERRFALPADSQQYSSATRGAASARLPNLRRISLYSSVFNGQFLTDLRSRLELPKDVHW